MNKVVLYGRFTRDPELRYTQSGKSVCSFIIAVDKGLSKERKAEAEMKGYQTADFIKVTFWGAKANTICRFFSKGRAILISGSIRTGRYQDSNGNTIYTTEVYGDGFNFVDYGDRNERHQAYQQKEIDSNRNENVTEKFDLYNGDIPF